MTRSDQPTKLLGLELLRFGCALAVLLYHFKHFALLPGAPALTIDEQPLATVLYPAYRFGLFGVQFFWAISGFIFFWKYGDAIAGHAVDGAKFFWLRFSRLYPLHFVTLLAVAALQPLFVALHGAPFVYDHDTPIAFVAHLVMATQWGAQAPFSFNGPIWSVSAEVFVYALFFLLLSRFGNALAMTATVLLAATIAVVAGIGTPVVFCLLFFFAGGLAAQLHRIWHEAPRSRHVAAALTVAVPGLFALAGLPLTAETINWLILFALPPALFWLADDPPSLRRFAAPIELAGNLTYSTYLCHFPLQLMLAILVAASGWLPPLGSPLFLAAYVGVTLGIGYLVYERFEKPAQTAIRAWRKARQPALA